MSLDMSLEGKGGLTNLQHQTVLREEAVDAWFTDPDGIYIDGTFGRGGHSRLLLSRLSDKGRLLLVDRDPEAIVVAKQLSAAHKQVSVIHSDFRGIEKWVVAHDYLGQVSGILLDLGVSSPQLDKADRGFSFMRDGPLDMRMDPSSGQSAAQWLALADREEIAKVLREYGEERFAWKIAGAIIDSRATTAIATTGQLASLIEQTMPFKQKGKHPATRSFQAIRIYINRELEQIETFLDSSVNLLRCGGRLAVISFHSLEDRIVKRFIRDQSRGDKLPSSVPVIDDALNKRFKRLGKAQRASSDEINNNPRSRSAILRVAERL